MAKTKTTAIKTNSTAPTHGVPVVVTTEHRGVFFGYMSPAHSKNATCVRIERARMCVHWTTETRGVVGLAATGPLGRCRITPAAPAMSLQKVTAIMECSAEAAAKWEEGPWN